MPIFAELFFHCDQYGCEAHAYVAGEPVARDATVAATRVELPSGWGRRDGKVFCAPHKELHNGEAAVS